MMRWLVAIVILTMCLSVKASTLLSLDDAILLSLRKNPDIKSARLSLLQQKLSRELAEWDFAPHYQFSAGTSWDKQRDRYGNRVARQFNVRPGVSMKSTIGTTASLELDNEFDDHYQPSLTLQIKQPLLKGFGKPIVTEALMNAIDSEHVSALTLKATLQSTILSVVNSYIDLMTAERTLKIDEAALKRAQASVDQTKKFIKAGHKAGNELITVRATVQHAKLQLENDKNNLLQQQFALKEVIGLNPNASIQFEKIDVSKLIHRYPHYTLAESKKQTLRHTIQYQIDKLTFDGATKRAFISAKDQARWQLDFNATGRIGGNDYEDKLLNLDKKSESASLTLTIPIDDKSKQQAIQNAKIAIQRARMNLRKEKWQLETKAINAWNSVQSAKRALVFAEKAEKLQEKTYKVGYKKYLHGLIDSLELQSAQLQLIESQQALLNAKITYLKSLASLDLAVGHTLETWHIELKDL